MKFSLKDIAGLVALAAVCAALVRQQFQIADYRKQQGELFSSAVRYAVRRCDYLQGCQAAANRDAELAILEGKINALQAQLNQLKTRVPRDD